MFSVEELLTQKECIEMNIRFRKEEIKKNQVELNVQLIALEQVNELLKTVEENQPC